MNMKIRRTNNSRETPPDEEHIKYRNTPQAEEHLEQENKQDYIAAWAHPEQEKIQSKSTRNTEVHWNRSTGEGDSEQE